MVRVSLEWGLYVKGSFALDIELWWFSSIGFHVCFVKASGSWSAILVNTSLCSELGYRLDLVVFLIFPGFLFSVVLCCHVRYFGAPLHFCSPSRWKYIHLPKYLSSVSQFVR